MQSQTDGETIESLCAIFKFEDTQEGNLSDRQPLLFSSMLPRSRSASLLSSSNAYDSRSSKEMAIRLALWHVNVCSDLPAMKRFYLTTKFFDTCCDARVGSKVYVDVIAETSNLGVIGPELSSVAVPTARFSTYLNLSMVSFGAAASELANREKCKTFFRLSAPEELETAAWVELIKSFSWTRVALVHELGFQLDHELSAIGKALQMTGISIVLSLSSLRKDFNATYVAEEIVATRSTVILAMVSEVVATSVLCASFHMVKFFLLVSSCCGVVARQIFHKTVGLCSKHSEVFCVLAAPDSGACRLLLKKKKKKKRERQLPSRWLHEEFSNFSILSP